MATTLEAPSDRLSKYLLQKKLSIGNRQEQTQRAVERQLKLVRDFGLIMAIAMAFSVVTGLMLALISGNVVPFVLSSIQGLAVLIVLSARVIARPGANELKARLSAYLVIFAILIICISNCSLEGSESAVTSGFLICVIAAGLLGLNLKDIAICSGLTLLGLTIPFVLEKILKVYTVGLDFAKQYPWLDLVIWWLALVTAVTMVGLFVMRYQETNRTLEDQTDLLQELLQTINATTEFSSSLSQELSKVTAELNTSSRDHLSNSHEQVAAVTQVTASLEELTETANQIAASARAATTSAAATVNIAEAVKEASQLAQTVADQGSEAVSQTLISVERVRSRIELLGQRLLNLTEQTRRVGTIIDLIDEIADETHLLALNASIEAAGSITRNEGENRTFSSRRGERFGVIAQEIKNLAERSRESTEEVRQAIQEMQGAVASAVLVAEEGKKETASALSRSQISGLVIRKLNESTGLSAKRAIQILAAVAEVNVRCDEISIATGQQRSANQQILSTMRDVAEVARESAGTINQFSENVSRVNHRIGELNLVLTESNSSLHLLSAN